MIEIRHIILNSNYSSIVFKYFKIGSGRVPDRLISGHLGFLVIRVRVGSGFRSSDLRSSRVSGCLGFGSGLVSNHLISSFGSSGFGSSWVLDTLMPGCLGFQVVSDRVGSGRVGFSSGRVEFGSFCYSNSQN
jgi:hypothetical protein